MTASLFVRGGTVVSSARASRLDVRIVEGTIAEVGEGLRPGGEPIVDAGGLHVLPGILDAHSHLWEPGLASRPDFRDDTASAALGGITTIIDHPLTTPEVLSLDRLKAKAELGERTSHIDFALHGGLSPDHLEDVPAMWDAGATAFKMFTCETGCAMGGFIAEADQRRALRAATAVGAVVLVHAEDQAMLDENRATMEADGRHAARDFPRWRSLEAEVAAVQTVLRLAMEESAAPYFVHCSAPDVVDLIAKARANGLRTWAETCPHYLWLSTDDITDHGHRATTSPPVRDPARVDALRTRLKDSVAVVGSDNGAVFPERKDIDDAFLGQPGLPGNETMLPLMLELVARGELTLPRLVSLVSETPARIFGLGRKGVVEPGADGDLTLVDLAATTDVRADTLKGSAGWTPYEGRRLQGRVETTVLRGDIVAQGGELLTEPGHGRFVRRDP